MPPLATRSSLKRPAMSLTSSIFTPPLSSTSASLPSTQQHHGRPRGGHLHSPFQDSTCHVSCLARSPFLALLSEKGYMFLPHWRER